MVYFKCWGGPVLHCPITKWIIPSGIRDVAYFLTCFRAKRQREPLCFRRAGKFNYGEPNERL